MRKLSKYETNVIASHRSRMRNIVQEIKSTLSDNGFIRSVDVPAADDPR